MVVLVKLNIAGADTGPNFDLYWIDSGDNQFLLETDVTKTELTTGDGYEVTVDDDAVKIRIQSKGVCTNYIDVDIIVPSTTTSTSTSTSTTTTSTSSTTTTTTTAAPITINVTNDSTDVIITEPIQVNGNNIVVTSGSYPVATGQSLTGTISAALGVGVDIPITVQYTYTTNGATQKVTCGGATPACQLAEGGSPLSAIRTNIAGDTINISATNGTC